MSGRCLEGVWTQIFFDQIFFRPKLFLTKIVSYSIYKQDLHVKEIQLGNYHMGAAKKLISTPHRKMLFAIFNLLQARIC